MAAGTRTWFGLRGYEWLVIASAWAGWGFDVFDAVPFNSSRLTASRRCCT